MSAEIESRPVLRPAGNIAIPFGCKDQSRPLTTRKPPPSPPLKPQKILSSPLPSPRTAPAIPKSPVLKPSSASPSPKILKRCPSSPSPGKPWPSPSPVLRPVLSHSSSFNGLPRAPPLDLNAPSAYTDSNSISPNSTSPNSPTSTESNKVTTPPPPPKKPAAPRITLTRSRSDTSRRHQTPLPPSPAQSSSSCSSSPLIKTQRAPSSRKGFIRSHSLDEATLAELITAKKVAANELNAQRRLKAAEYGRKIIGKSSRVAPESTTEEASSSPATAEPQRCKFITAQSDPLYVAYHDEEWGVPVHEDKKLFELLVLAGAQAELSWSTILHQRHVYREVFCGYDPEIVAMFTEKHIQLIESDRSLLLPGGKIRGIVENARRILEVVKEFGSLNNYIWGFVNHKPMVNGYRYPKQVPVKTSKAESISKDLVKRGFRNVGATIVYSFMQASGMSNDHLTQCFRYQQCIELSSHPESSQVKFDCGECNEDPLLLERVVNDEDTTNPEVVY